jgi:hypothetical protein
VASTNGAGANGTLTLNVSRGSVTGSATLAPVDPSTGIAAGAPSVNVTYGPLRVGANDGSAKGNSYLAEDCSAFVTRLGMFCLPSTPAGYTLIGGFVPAGLPGARRGLAAGTAYTAATSTGQDGLQTFGPALPGAFEIPAK